MLQKGEPMTMFKHPHHLLICSATLIVAAFTISGCTKPEKSTSEQAQALMADSSARAILVQKIVEDPRTFVEIQQLMMQQHADTAGGGICNFMMQKARSDSVLAEHMCTVIASDTMMAAKMRAKLGISPTRQAQRQTPGVHDKTHVAAKRKQ